MFMSLWVSEPVDIDDCAELKRKLQPGGESYFISWQQRNLTRSYTGFGFTTEYDEIRCLTLVQSCLGRACSELQGGKAGNSRGQPMVSCGLQLILRSPESVMDTARSRSVELRKDLRFQSQL